ncbi:MAG: hypothetical protein RLP44_19110 [Aggregatilineales bacterium]
MPITLTRLEAGIYHGNWHASVTTNEVFGAMDELSAIATEQGDERLVCIIDLTNCTKIPFDVHNMKNLSNREARMNGFVVMKANTLARVMGQMLDKISTKSFKFTETLEESIALAHEIRISSKQPENR